MADKIEMHVLAIGQGSCGLVAYYDKRDRLVQLDLCDCGSSGCIDEGTLDNQMDFIRKLMEKRAIDLGISAKYYLDNIIISHKDEDHLNLFTYDYFFNGIKQASEADKRISAQEYERNRIEYLFASSREEYMSLHAIHKPDTSSISRIASVEYNYSNKESYSDLLCEFKFSRQCIPQGDGSFHMTDRSSYRSELNFSKTPLLPDYRRFDFSYQLHIPSQDDSFSWYVSGSIKGVLHFFLDVSQFMGTTPFFEPRVIFFLNAGERKWISRLPDDKRFKVPLGISSWAPEALTAFDNFTREVFDWLLEDKFKELFPEESTLDAIREDFSILYGFYMQSFREMTDFLTLRMPILLEKDGKAIEDTLFGPDGSIGPSDEPTMAVGHVYVGGVPDSKISGIADKALKTINTFCSNRMDPIDGFLSMPDGLTLMQMPSDISFQNPMEAASAPPPSGAYVILSNKDAFVKASENDRSLMYISPLVQKCRAIFPGDSTGLTMKYFINEFPKQPIALENTWLASPHHGSWKTCETVPRAGGESPLEDYLECLSPRFLFISSGYNNRYHHPRGEFLDIALSLVPATASLHCLYRCNYANKRSQWFMQPTQTGIYSTLTQNDNGNSYYCNLIMASDIKEPRIEGPVQTLPGRFNIFKSDAGKPFARTRPLPRDAFPFLFDEPMDAFAL